MSNTLRPYLNAIRVTLDAALCLRSFPSQLVRAARGKPRAQGARVHFGRGAP